MPCFPNFNSRPSARGDKTTTTTTRTHTHFNSRPSARGDAHGGGFNPDALYFNSRPSARGDDLEEEGSKWAEEFQFTPLREGRRGGVAVIPSFRGISIHAPPRGATRRPATARTQARDFNSRPSARGDRACRFLALCGFPFQFTPLREGRRDARGQRHVRRYFNSRPSARGDNAGKSGIVMPQDFNSRPSARGDAPERRGGTQLPDFNSRPSARGDDAGRRHRRGLRHFNSRPSARGDRQAERKLLNNSYFNSRPSARGDIQTGGVRQIQHDFNSRPSARGDHQQSDFWLRSKISIHAPPRGATRLRELYIYTNLFQFTPLREGRRPCRGYKARTRAISIHAPPRGATSRLREIDSRGAISIHAPPRGATLRRSPCSPPSSNFNSRPSARGDEKRSRKSEKGLISIHAPPRGATKDHMIYKKQDIISIHAPPRGATFCAHFNSETWQNFNSRPSARGDRKGERGIVVCPISIHAPPRGATMKRTGTRAGVPISIHAPPRGATYFCSIIRAISTYFNSRPSARGDACRRAICRIHRLFQFTPLREGRQ